MRTKTSARRPHEGRGRSVVVGAIGLLVAIPALTYSLYLDPPADMAQNGERLVADAATSLSASVPANPYNTLAGQLADEKAQLDERQADLAAQERAASQADFLGVDWGFVSFCISAVLLALVGLNFYLDTRRRGGRQSALSRAFLVDLR